MKKRLRIASRQLSSYLMRDGALVSPLVALLLCVAFTFICFYVTYQVAAEDARSRFNQAANLVAVAFEEKLRLYATTALATRNFIQIHPDLTEKQFTQFVQGMDWGAQLEGVQALSFARRFSRGETTPPQEVSVWPVTPNKLSFPIIYVEQMSGAAPSVKGYDLYSHDVRRAAIEKAIETGEPVATGKMQPVLITPGSPETSFSIYAPIFNTQKPLKNAKQRTAALRGVVTVSLRSSNFFERMTKGFQSQFPGLGIEFFSGEEISNDSVLYAVPLAKEVEVGFEQIIPVSALENSWVLRITAAKGFGATSNRGLPFLVLIFGLLFSIAIFQILLMIRKRNHQLAEEKQLLELTSKVGISLKAEQDLENIVQMVTKASARLLNVKLGAFQYATFVDEVQGLPFYSVTGEWQSSYTQVGQSLLMQQLENHKVIRISDLRNHPELVDQNTNIRSFLSAPIISKTGKIWGGLFFADLEPDKFSRRSESIAEVIAIQAAVAMDNANLYRSLRLAQDDAMAAAQAKSTFLAHMSHEIRTPLGVILGFAELARTNIKDAVESEKYLDLILRNGEELTRIIGEILDLSKIEAHSLQIEEADFAFNVLLDDIQSLLGLKAQEKGLTLIIDKDPKIPQFIKSDRTRIRQILVNLIGNALRFTSKGSVTLEIISHPSDNFRERILEFLVTDTGIGISKEQQANLFKAFSQADSSIARRFGGTGLGLVIARELAVALGGDLTLKSSVPGKGTCFAGKIRVKDATPKAKAISEPVINDENALRGLNILVVDDSSDNQLLFTTYLKKAGASVDCVGNGKLGVEKALNSDYAIVLMDLQMPIMDGYEAIEELRSKKYQKPVIALTAHALMEEKEKALSLGFTDYLTKPVKKGALISSIQSHVK